LDAGLGGQLVHTQFILNYFHIVKHNLTNVIS
jgi:hypothetical protein